MHSKSNHYHSRHIHIQHLLEDANIFNGLKDHNTLNLFRFMFVVWNIARCPVVLVPQRRETWLEYLWELIDCCCWKFRWKALEISLSLFMMLWLLQTRCSYPLFCANWTFITWILPLWWNVLYCKQMDSNQPQFSDIKREEGALQFLCSSTLQTLPRVIVTVQTNIDFHNSH